VTIKNTLIFFLLICSQTAFSLSKDLDLLDRKYEWKEQIKCLKERIGTDPLYPNREAVKYKECPDQTISHIQPPSIGLNGWEGYCGQTAASNLTSMLCDRHLLPKSNDQYGKDITPGQHSSTMKRSLKKIFSEQASLNSCPLVTWKVKKSLKAATFLQKLKDSLFHGEHQVRRYRSENDFVLITPVPVLINSGGLNYHWVTIVDMPANAQDKYGCDAVMNTWGEQRVLTCEKLVKYADHTGLGERVSLGVGI
jgi:hypothetical protein